MRAIRFMVLLLFAVSLHAAGPDASSILQFRRVFDDAGPDRVKMHLRRDHGADEVLYVGVNPVLTGAAVDHALLKKDAVSGETRIAIKFTDDGKKEFANLTAASLGQRLAIIVDGHLQSAPRIAQRIALGWADISGNFTDQEARDLVARINRAVER